MAIGNYAQLQTAIGNWLARNDLAATIPDFIRLAESRINRRLRVAQMLTRATTQTVPGDSYILKPADFLEMRNIEVSGSPNMVLEYATPAVIDRKYRSDWVGRPSAYTILGQEVQLAPVPDAEYVIEMAYYAKVPELEQSNTNWLIQQAPDIYLYGALIEAKAFIEDEKFQLWKAAFDEAINDLTRSDKRAKFSGSGLRQRSM